MKTLHASARPFSSPLRRVLLGTALAAGTFLFAAAALADEWLDRANESFKSIQPDKRSDTVLLPLLAKLTDPPAGVAKADLAALLPAASTQFQAAADWAQLDTSKAVLEALSKVTTNDLKPDWKKAYGFGQPYGSQDVDPDLYAIKMYTELGEQQTLAEAKILYLPALAKMESLVQVEATRLAADGKAMEALDLLVRFTHFARQIADRKFFAEQKWAYESMCRSLERMRDIAYQDIRSSGGSHLNSDAIRDGIRRLKDRGGLMGLDRLKLPEAERLATRQIVGRIFEPGAGPNPSFSRILATVSTQKHPLRIFSETAKWDAVAVAHEGEKKTATQADNVYNDWASRWELPRLDVKLKLPTTYARLDKVKYAALDAMLGDISSLFDKRWQLEAELVGTRMSLAHVAFFLSTKSLAPEYSSIRPRIIDPKAGDALDTDPFSSKGEPLGFFVPIRDVKVAGAEPKPHVVRVFVPGVKDPFEKKLGDDGFMLYGRGPDGNDTRCTRATQLVEDEKGDFLMWPPVMSLYREHLETEGKLP